MMRQVLKELRERIGVRGSQLLTRDGVIVASDLSDGLDSDAVAALASAAIGAARRSVEKLEFGPPQRMVLTSSVGRLLFQPIGDLILVVVTEPGLALEHTLLEVAGPARRIRELSKFDSSS